MIKVNVKLFGTLRKSVPQYDPGKGVEVTLREGDTLRDLVRSLELSGSDSKVFLIRGRARSSTHQLNDLDEVSIFLPIGGG